MHEAVESPSNASWLRLGMMVALVAGVELVSSAVTIPNVRDWYPTLLKPAWTPPDWVFGPVWTTLYVMIALSGWRLWEQVRRIHAHAWRHPAMQAFAAQLAANLGWSLIFFGLHATRLALAEILLLDALILLTIRRAWGLDRPAAWLLVPYLFWVLYATSLNAGIAWLNR